ncbi:MAG: lipocalin family protein [Myxococcota bacterium]
MKARIIFLLLSAHVAYSNSHELTPVPFVDLQRYAGTWHEIARLPDSAETNCVESKAEYLWKNGAMQVRHFCRKANGSRKQSVSKIAIENPPNNSKLKIQLGPKWLNWVGLDANEHWIIDLDPNYQFAVVSEPGKRQLKILSRTPTLEKPVYDKIIAELKARHFDLSHLIVLQNTQPAVAQGETCQSEKSGLHSAELCISNPFCS